MRRNLVIILPILLLIPTITSPLILALPFALNQNASITRTPSHIGIIGTSHGKPVKISPLNEGPQTIEGNGAPLNLTEYCIKNNIYTDLNEHSVVSQSQPNGWNITKVSCDIDNVTYTTMKDDLVPDGDFSQNPWSNWTEDHYGESYSYGWESDDPSYIWHRFDWLDTFNRWSIFYTTFDVPSADLCNSALLSFKYNVVSHRSSTGTLQVLFDGVVKWSQYFSSSTTGWMTVNNIDVTDLVKQKTTHKITLKLKNPSVLDFNGGFEAQWDDVILKVTWPESNLTLFSLDGHSFSQDGHVDFPTNKTEWQFYGPPDANFDAALQVTISKNGTVTPSYTAQPNQQTTWNISVETSTPTGWNYKEYNVTGIPPDWSYSGCSPSGAGTYSGGVITGTQSATYTFNQDNIIQSLEWQLRFPDNDTTLRPHTYHFMRGESFAINMTGTYDGQADGEIQTPSGGTWTLPQKTTTSKTARWTSSTNDPLTFATNDEYGKYTCQVTLNASNGLHISTAARDAWLGGYRIAQTDAVENNDGSVSVSVSFSSYSTGTPNLWVSSIVERSPAYDEDLDLALGGTGIKVTHWKQNDTILSNETETFDVELELTNTNPQQKTVTIHVDYVACLNESYTPIQLQKQATIEAGGTHIFQWSGVKAGEGNLLLRRGMYSVRVTVEVGSNIGEAHLDEEIDTAFLVVSNGTDIDGRILARKFVASSPGSYNVTFSGDELPVPAQCHILATIEDQHHITTEHIPGTTHYQDSLILKLFTNLTDPSGVVEAGVPFTLNTTLTEEQARNVEHSDAGVQFTIHFYIDLNGDSNFDPDEHETTTIGMGETAQSQLHTINTPGGYAVKCVFEGDGEHKPVTVTGTLTVQETTPPTWDQPPSNQTWELGVPFTYDLNATDLSGLDTWWINDTQHFQINSNGVIINATNLQIGKYGLQVWVNDTWGNTQTATFKVTVQDTTPPTIEEQMTTAVTGICVFVDLNATDLSGIGSWWINDTGRFQIDSNGIITNVTSVPRGYYYVLVQVADVYGNTLTFTLKLIVDAFPPEWVVLPSNQTCELGRQFEYQLNVSDISAIDSWWLNDTRFQVNSDGLVSNATWLPVGVYWVRVWVNDTWGNTQTATFKVTVQDTTPPTIEEQPDVQIAELGHTLTCKINASDLSGLDTWWINNTQFFTIHDGILTNTDIIPVGVYWVRVWVNDTWGNTQTLTIKIIIIDTTPPTWKVKPNDQVLEEGVLVSLQLEAWDLAGITHWTVNDTQHFAITSTGWLFTPTPLRQGTYHLTVTVHDPNGNTLTTTIKVVVLPAMPPAWTQQPPSTVDVEYGSHLSLQLEANDSSGLCAWWINDTQHFHIDQAGLVTNACMLEVGTYRVQVWVNDTAGYTQTTTITIHVKDTTPPTWIERPTIIIINQGEYVAYQLEAWDLSGIAGWQINDTEHFTITTSGLLIVKTQLPPGTYHVKVTVQDPYGNTASATIKIVARQATSQTPAPSIQPPLTIGLAATATILAILAVLNIMRTKKPPEKPANTPKVKSIKNDNQQDETQTPTSPKIYKGK